MALPAANVLGNPATTTAEFQAAIEAQRQYLADLVFSNIAGVATAAQLPAATTSAIGAVELATDAETQAGTDTARAVTPAGLRACTARSTRIGVVELATDAETQTGTDTARSVTPASLRACTATETRIGVVELATSAEAIAGTDTTRAVTPAGLSAAMRPTTVSGHVRAGNTQIPDGSVNLSLVTRFVTTDMATDVWETYGPTGSGATNIWNDLDFMPAGTGILIADIGLSLAGSAANQDLTLFVAIGGITVSTIRIEHYLATLQTNYNVAGERTKITKEVHIPVSASGVFQLRWNCSAGTPIITMNYRGFIVD